MKPEDIVYFTCLVVAVILHEISHGVVALAFGDDTAKRAGRLTLNPVPHIDPLGSIILPAFAVLTGAPFLGWAKPVPVNPSNLRNPRRQMLYVGLVGPFTNFALMMVAAVAARLVPPGDGGIDLRFVLIAFAAVNLFLGVFNLLPIPPLDGSSLIERFLPHTWLPTWWKIRPYGFLILLVGLFYIRIFEKIITPFARALGQFINP
ncbi:MAG: site-2 protease family protein [Actinomycetota bacterium]|nr:site-2 protease family protein [Actinomycetota bacterium]